MNLHESELEDQLRALSPAAPSEALARAIANDLRPRERTLAVRVSTAAILARPATSERRLPDFLRGFGWALAGAAAAVAVIFAIEHFDSRRPAALTAEVDPLATDFELAESSAELLAAEDEGIVYADPAVPARQIRFSSIERQVWTDAATGARMEIEIPREDIRLTPVAMQ